MVHGADEPGTAEPCLHPYQTYIIAEMYAAIAAGKRRILLVAPTGAGKTVIAAAIIRGFRRAMKNVLFLAHRRELVSQASSKLTSVGCKHGIIQMDLDCSVQVASIQTLSARAIQSRKMQLPPADVVIVDEAHHVRADSYRKILAAYPDAIVVGLTATPCRGDGRGLGNVFEAMIECPGVADLIDAGHLVSTKVYAPSTPDLKGVHVKMGDYVESELAKRMNTDKLVGDIVQHWHRLAGGRPTIIFATGVAIRSTFGISSCAPGFWPNTSTARHQPKSVTAFSPTSRPGV